jgi:hypothetical protein
VNDHACPICGGEPAIRAARYPWGYLQCKDCFTSFLGHVPSEKDLRAFYATYHKPGADGGTCEQFEARAAQDSPRKLRLVQEAVPPPARLLDGGVSLCRGKD